MKNWLRFWKNHHPHDLEALLRAARPEAPAELVQAIKGEVRPQPVRRNRPIRVGRAVLVAATAALVVAAVSSAAGLGLRGGLLAGDIYHPFSGPSIPSAADQYAVGPHITSISPLQGTVGTVITITGTGLAQVDAVTINGTAAASFTHASTDLSASITATVASGTGASGHVEVENTAGSDTSTDTFLFAAAVPSNTAAPHITGTTNLNGFALALVGNALTVSDGTWSGSPTSFTYQWADCDSSYSSCSNIGGATSNTYTLASSDLGHTVKVFVTAHNPAGASSPASPPNNDLKGNVGAANPTAEDQGISGTPQVGNPLLAVNGSWGGTGTITFSYQWYQCGASAPSSPSDCSAISGATGSTYSPDSGDAGHFIGLHISGSTTNGSNGWSEFVSTSAPVIGTAVIDSFSPTSGGFGTSVTITGSNFTGAVGVRFNTTAATSFHVDSATQITATVPTGATTGKITVSMPSGIAAGVSSASFTVLPLPTVSSFVPTAGVAGTTSVVINGTNFTNVSAVNFNGVAATTSTVNSATRITATVPVGATTGHISVTTPAGTGTSVANFLVYQTPVIDSFNPALQQPGGNVQLFGHNFFGVSATNGVTLDSTPVKFTVTTDGATITATVPLTMALGTHTWHVANPAGTGDSTGTFTVGAVNAPTIASFSPTEGPANAEFTTQVTIHGTNFTGVTSVLFGTKAATGFTVDTTTPSDNTITVNAPVGATTAQIQVINAKGTAKTATPFVVDLPPSIASFSPTSGRPTVTNVVISGARFVTHANGGLLSFGGTDQPVFTVNPLGTQITAQVPAGASTGPITFTNTGIGHFTTAANFIVTQIPTITTFTPQVGKAGTPITVTGSHFLGGSTPTVKFQFADGTVLGTGVKILSDTSLTVAAPVRPITYADTTANLIVHNDAGDSTASTDEFAYNGVPTVTTLSPTHGPANTQMSTAVTITGTNFDGTTNVLFGSKAAAVVNVISETQISALAPVGATSGPISVVTPVGTGKSVGNFTVDPLPTIASFSPAPPLGADPGGTVVVKGTNFSLLTGYAVHGVSVNGTDLTEGDATIAGQFHVDSSTQITMKLPASGASTGKIVVNNPDVGSATSAANLIVRNPPTIDSFSPASGITGTKVTLTGSGFLGTGVGGLSVTFDGDGSGAKTVTALQIVNDTTAIAGVPTGATTGTISVHNSQGDDTSADTFVVAIRPTISTFDPVSGPASSQATTYIDIQGTHLNGTTAVMFGKLASPLVVVNDDGDVTAIVPAGAATGKITLTNPAGSITSAGTFTVDGPPSVTSISPSSAAVGDVVTINGRNLIGEMDGTQYPNDTVVDFHGVFDAVVDPPITSTQMQVEVPTGATTGPLLVSDVWGQTAVTPLFTIVTDPSISDFSNEFTTARSGKKGAPVVITGSGFTGTTSVRFNGVSASYVILADWEIIAIVPKTATTGPITVTNPASTATTAPTNFTVLP